eukprot:Amastigsp_a509585_14.p2 type:complete len:402 gc:universal Amastigsp_a509585_14:1316-111(-)
MGCACCAVFVRVPRGDVAGREEVATTQNVPVGRGGGGHRHVDHVRTAPRPRHRTTQSHRQDPLGAEHCLGPRVLACASASHHRRRSADRAHHVCVVYLDGESARAPLRLRGGVKPRVVCARRFQCRRRVLLLVPAVGGSWAHRCACGVRRQDSCVVPSERSDCAFHAAFSDAAVLLHAQGGACGHRACVCDLAHGNQGPDSFLARGSQGLLRLCRGGDAHVLSRNLPRAAALCRRLAGALSCRDVAAALDGAWACSKHAAVPQCQAVPKRDLFPRACVLPLRRPVVFCQRGPSQRLPRDPRRGGGRDRVAWTSAGCGARHDCDLVRRRDRPVRARGREGRARRHGRPARAHECDRAGARHDRARRGRIAEFQPRRRHICGQRLGPRGPRGQGRRGSCCGRS